MGLLALGVLTGVAACAPTDECSADADCGPGQICQDGECTALDPCAEVENQTSGSGSGAGGSVGTGGSGGGGAGGSTGSGGSGSGGIYGNCQQSDMQAQFDTLVDRGALTARLLDARGRATPVSIEVLPRLVERCRPQSRHCSTVTPKPTSMVSPSSSGVRALLWRRILSVRR